MKGSGGDVKINTRFEEKRWNRKGKREGETRCKVKRGELFLCYSVVVKFFHGSYFKPELWFSLQPCGEYIMNVPLLSMDHIESQDNLFPVSTRS